jgi:hypothetical protein
MLFSLKAILAIHLKAQGIDPSEVLFAKPLVLLSPFDHSPVPRFDTMKSMEVIEISSDSESDCSNRC